MGGDTSTTHPPTTTKKQLNNGEKEKKKREKIGAGAADELMQTTLRKVAGKGHDHVTPQRRADRPASSVYAGYEGR